jgi:hypothetical protein
MDGKAVEKEKDNMKLIKFDGNIFKADTFIDASIEHNPDKWNESESFYVKVRTDNGELLSFNKDDEDECRDIIEDIFEQLTTP